MSTRTADAEYRREVAAEQRAMFGGHVPGRLPSPTRYQLGCRCHDCTQAAIAQGRRVGRSPQPTPNGCSCPECRPGSRIEVAIARGWSRSQIMRELGVEYSDVAIVAERMAS